MTSPKTMISEVITTVAMPTPIFPNKYAAIAPARIEAVMFTKLLQTTTALITSSGLSKSFSSKIAFFLPFTDSSRTLILSIDTKAISAAAKNDDNKMRSPITGSAINHIVFILDMNIFISGSSKS